MRFTVWKKIGGCFCVVVILLLIVFLYTFSVVNVAIKSNDKFLKVDQPSLFLINHLKEDIAKTHTYMQQWVIEESRPDEQWKVEAEILLDQTLKLDLDTTFREEGIGDMSIGKHVKKYVKKFYYRIKVIDPIIEKTDFSKLYKYLKTLKSVDKNDLKNIANELLELYEELKQNIVNH